MFDAAPPVVVPAPVPPADFSIARLPERPSFSIVRRPCADGAPGEIVVCGRRDDGRYRLGPLPPSGLPAAGPLDLGFDVAGARVVPEIEQVQRSDGWVDQRVWVRVRFPF